MNKDQKETEVREKLVVFMLLSVVGVSVLVQLLANYKIDDEPARTGYYVPTTIVTSSYVGTASITTTTTL